MQNLFRIILISSLAGAGCSFPGVYKINIQQGNIVTQSMLDKVKPGMTRRQVHFVLGTPLIENTFDRKSESYIYSFQQGGEETKQQTVIIYYESEAVSKIASSALLPDTPAY